MALLNLTNFDDHPTDPTWLVFRFGDADMAKEFIAGLDAAAIPHQDDLEGRPRLIAVKQRHRDAAIRIDYKVLGHHRRPFIGSTTLRWGLLLVTAALLAIAVAGWWRSI